MASRVLADFTMQTVSEANWRGVWQARAARVKKQRQAVGVGVDDVAVLVGSLKAVRDAVAAWLGVDDGPKGPVTWAYAQEVTKSPLMRVRIEVGS